MLIGIEFEALRLTLWC